MVKLFSLKKFNIFPFFFVLSFFCVAFYVIEALEKSPHINFNLVWLIEVTGIYIISHLVRFLRLFVLTVNSRDYFKSLIMVHTLTAFPSSFLPFKLGEILRIFGFISTYKSPSRGIGIWLCERIYDILIICGFIIFFYFLGFDLSENIKILFLAFALSLIIFSIGLFALNSFFRYISPSLILKSTSQKSLKFLSFIYKIESFNSNINQLIEGRFLSLFFISFLIWALEISAITIYSNQFYSSSTNIPTLFLLTLVSDISLFNFKQQNFPGLYQSLALIFLFITTTLIFIFHFTKLSKEGNSNVKKR